MSAARVLGVVLQLVRIHDPALRKKSGHAITQERGIGKRHTGQRLGNLVHERDSVARSIATKLHGVALVADAKFIQRVVTEGVGPVHKRGLAQRRFVERVSRGDVGRAAVGVEEDLLLKQVAHIERVSAGRVYIELCQPIVNVKPVRESTLNSRDLVSAGREPGVGIGGVVHRSAIAIESHGSPINGGRAGADSIRTVGLQRRHTRAAGIAGGKLRYPQVEHLPALAKHLPALAKHDFPLLRRVCGVDDEDLSDMIAEIRRLEPKPGRAFGDPPAAPAIPDVHVTAAPDLGWRVELNTRALPRVLVNEVYAAEIRRGAKREEDRQYVSTQLQAANWLTKSLEQRARTILNVASEIVRRQDSFLLEGVSGLKPLNLKMVGEAIGVHESTVSRATAHKFIQTPRGLFEMKYFFTAAIASSAPGLAHSAEAVRQRIRQMIDDESPAEVLSDDVIVERLRKADIVVARRTVAKYRDSLRIPSSVERRKMKMAPMRDRAERNNSLAIEV